MPVMTAPSTTLGALNPEPNSALILIGLTELTDFCTIERRTVEEDGLGGVTPGDWATLAENVPCLLEKPTFTEDVQGGALTAASRWHLHLPLGTDIVKTDRVVKSGLYYEVMDADTSATATLTLMVIVTRIER